MNEVLSHTDIPQVDVIELYNPTGGEANVGGWYLSDDKDTPKKFQIPAATMIGAGAYWAVNEDNDANLNSAPAGYFGSAFRISSRGDEIYLFSADGGGELTGYRHGFKFRATINGRPDAGDLTLGRYLDTFGREHFTKQVRSFDVNRFVPNPAAFTNNPPSVGPVVISEINFDPAPGGSEYIELKNISGAAVLLYDASQGGDDGNNWSLDGIGGAVNPDTNWFFPGLRPVLPSDATVIILPKDTDAAAFRAANSVPAEPAAFVIGGLQGYQGALNNGGEELTLLMPDKPDLVPGEGTIVPQIAVDVVNYRDSDFWPDAGGGVTLEKFNLSGFSDDPINWRSGTPDGGTPGTVPEGMFYDLWAVQNFSAGALAAGTAIGCEDDANGDGIPNLFAYAFGYDPETPPAGSDFPQGSIVVDGGSNYMALSFRMQAEATDLTYQLESSTDVKNWMDTDGVQVGAPQDNGDGTVTVQFRSEQSIDDEDRLFMRLNLMKQ